MLPDLPFSIKHNKKQQVYETHHICGTHAICEQRTSILLYHLYILSAYDVLFRLMSERVCISLVCVSLVAYHPVTGILVALPPHCLLLLLLRLLLILMRVRRAAVYLLVLQLETIPMYNYPNFLNLFTTFACEYCGSINKCIHAYINIVGQPIPCYFCCRIENAPSNTKAGAVEATVVALARSLLSYCPTSTSCKVIEVRQYLIGCFGAAVVKPIRIGAMAGLSHRLFAA